MKRNNDTERTEEMIKHSITTSLNRTKNKIYDLTKSNDWEYFITLTFNPDIIDSTDYDTVIRRMKNWINGIRKRYANDLIYLFVPELHSDGKKWHLHGLIANVGNIKFADSGHRTDAEEIIYNLPGWTAGFSTATKIKDSAKACSYITKYITKECVIHTKNKSRYYSSRNINKPDINKLNLCLTETDVLKTYSESCPYVKSITIPKAHNRVTHIEIDWKEQN